MTIASVYEEMAAHTVVKCAACRVPYSCCSVEYCEMAAEIAAAHGVVLTKGDHDRLPYLNRSTGCTVHPRYRPLCTIHVCSIANLGEDPDLEWTAAYFELRERINEAELELMSRR